ncbi:MAG: filamentous hemagglutinin N-terminal domain-containing protein, partial [Rhodanobacter sp.]
MSKHTSTRRESRNGVSMARVARLPSGSLPLRRTWPISLCIGLAIGSIAVSADALAGGPTGGTVVGGNGSITQSGNETVINQISQKLALNWETFNLKANESVLFNQPGRSAVALNRILDQNPSQIFGKINSNGQVFLINTHGIIFGATAQMNVGGLMASTLDLTPKDFLAGNYSLNAVGGGAGIVNHGLIQAASGGSVALVGGSVANDGVILANYGSINLDGAEHAVLDFDGNGLINIQITGELKQRLDAREAAVSNTGTLQAEGGTVVLQASAAKDLFTNLVNNSGVIDASGISTDGGVVRLVGTGGNVVNSGSIDASGEHGGSVQLLSDQNVGVTGGIIDASGTAGGGDIRVGGGWQGGEGLQTAQAVYVAPDATLKADATHRGDGGSVVVWGNRVNNFYGTITARGGASGGDGGRVETSAHDGLNAQGRVDASAPAGRAGSWLLDPHDVTLQASGTGSLGGTSPDKYFEASADDSTISTNVIEGALVGGTNVSIFTGTDGTQNGDITVADAIDAPGRGTLYLKAAGSIFVDSNITGTSGSGPLDLYLWANYGGAATDTAYTSRADCATCTVLVGRNDGTVGINIARGVLDIRTGDASHAGGLVQFGNGTAGSTGTIHAGAFSIHGTGIDMGWGNYQFDLLDTTLDAGTGSVSLLDTSGGSGLSFGGNLEVSGNQITLGSSGSTTTIKANTQNYNGAVTLGTNTTLVANTGAVNLAGSLTGTDKNLAITGDSISLDSDIALGTGSATLTATAGSISQTAGRLLSAGALTLNATTGIGVGSALETKVDTLTFTNSGAGGVALNDADALTVSGSTVSGDVTISAQTGDLTIDGDVSSAGNVTLGAGAGNVVYSSGTVSGDAVHFNAGGTNGSIGASGAVSTNASQLSFEARGTGVVRITEADGAAVSGTAGSGNVTITSTTGDLTLNGDLSTTGDVDLTALAGSISHTAGTISGGALTLTAGGTNGAIGASDAVLTNVNSIVFSAKGTGAVNIDEAAGVNVSGTAGSGSVGITSATSDLAVVGSGIVTAGGAVTLEASGSGARINIGGSGLDTTNGVAAGANVELVADNADILGTINAGTAGIATIRQATEGRPISLGPDVPDPAPPQLGVTAAELNLITANTIVIGDANSGNLSVNEAIAPAHANTLSLNTGGSISQVAGATITVGTLTGSAVGATTLGEANHIGNFGSFTASSLSLTNADPLTLVGDVTTSGAQTYNAAILLGGNTTLTTTNGAVNFNSTVDNADPTARNLTVNAGNGAVTFAGAVGGDATNGALGALIVNSAGLTTFANVTAASLVTDAGGGTLLGGNITTSGTQTYNDAVTLGNDIVLATTNSAVKFASTVDNATTTARALTVNAGNGALTFGGIVGGNATNGALGGLTTHSGSWSAGGLNIGSGGLSVTTTGGGITQGSKFVVTGLSVFNSGSDAITLENTGNDFQGAVSATGVGVSIIDANDLAMATLSNGPNGEVKLIAGGVLSLPLGAIATGNADLTLVSNGGPLITGDLSGANVSLTGLGLTLNNVTTAGTLNLASGATISQAPGSIITAGTLTGSSVGSTLLTGASNKIGTLGSFTAANLALTNAQALTVTGPVDGGVSTALTTTVGDLAINGAVTGTTTTLTSGGAITEGASGLITADTLTGSSVGNTTLLRANQVAALGAFATGGDFAFNNAQSLTVNAAPSANGGLGNLTLTTTGASSDLVLASNLVGNTVTLGSGRNISQTGGTIQATTLTGSSAGSTTLTGANHIGTLGSFSAAGFNLTNAQALAVTGPVDGGASTTLNTSGGDLAINGVVKGTTTTLTSDSAITEGAAGVIIAGTLTGSSTGGTTLNGSNQVGTLGSFTAASFSLTNAQALAVAGLVSGGASTTLITTAGNLAINGAVGGATTTLTSAGAITEGAGGAITAGTLTGSSAGDTTLNAANHVGNLGAFATGGDFAFNNAQSLTVSNAPSANGGAGDLTLTTTGASSDLVLNSNLIGNTVTLGSGRNISQTGGAITATTLSGSSVGSTALNGANQIGTLGSFTAANLALTNAQALTVTGPVDGGASTMLATTAGDLAINGTVKGTTTTLTSGGAITEGASGLITAGTLTGSSAGSTTLLQANQVTALGAFTTGGDFAFNNAQSLTVSNAPSANGGAGNLTLTTTGASSDLILASTLTGNTVSLGAGRNISQTAGSIQATTLTGSSVGSTTLNGANQIGTLGSFTAATLALTNAQALAVAGPVDGGASTALTTTAGDLAINGAVKGTTTTLTSAGAITEGAAGVITAGTLTGSSAGATTLNGANQIGTLGSFTAANFALTNAQALTVTGALDGGASTAL